MKAEIIGEERSEVRDEVKKLMEEAKAASQNDFKETVNLLQKAIRIASAYSFTDILIKAKINLGLLYFGEGIEEKFLYYLRKAIRNAKSIKDYENLEYGLSRMGIYYWNHSKYKRALYYFSQANSLVRYIKEPESLYGNYKNLAATYLKLLDKKQASDFIRKAYKVAKRFNQKVNIADNLYWRGLLYHQDTKYDKALKLYLESLNLNIKVKNFFGQAICLNSIGLVFRDWKEPQKALFYFKKCKAAGEKSPYQSDNIIADAYNNIGLIHSDSQNYDEALDNYLLSLEYRRKTGFKDHEATTLLNVANINHKKKDHEKALYYANQAVKIIKQMGDSGLLCSALTVIIEICLTNGKLKEAGKYVDELIRTGESNTDRVQLIQVYLTLTNYYTKAGDFEKALESSKKMHELKHTVFDDSIRRKMYDTEYNLKYEKTKLKIKNKIERERVKTVLALACTASHEINQPLMVIQGNVELLEIVFKDILGSGKGKAYITNVLESVEKIKKTLASLSNLEQISFKNYTSPVEMIEIKTKEKKQR